MHESRIQTRWSDFDALGHVTAAAYPIFLDQAREARLSDAVGPFSEWPSVLVHLSIDYRHEIQHPATEIVVWSRITEVGRTSITFEQEVIAPDGETAATSRSVLVSWDPETRAARAIGDDDRARLLA